MRRFFFSLPPAIKEDELLEPKRSRGSVTLADRTALVHTVSGESKHALTYILSLNWVASVMGVMIFALLMNPGLQNPPN